MKTHSYQVTCAGLSLVLLLLGSGCKDKGKPEPSPEATEPTETARSLDGGPDDGGGHAFLLIDAENTLQRVAVDGSAEPLGALSAQRWCQWDPQSRVVWGLGEGGLWAFAIDAGEVHQVVAEEGKAIESVQLEFPSGRVRGNADPLQHDATLVVSVSKVPMIRGDVICEGDRLTYCYDELEGEDRSKWVLSKAARDSLDSYKALELKSPEILVRLAESYRGDVKSPEPLVAPERPEVKVSSEECRADPEACGSLRYLGGGRMWAVVTENDSGDFFYQSEQIYDAQRKEFVDFEEGTRSRQPFDVASGADLDVSPDGRHAVTPGGKLLDLREGKTVKTFERANRCGWLQS